MFTNHPKAAALGAFLAGGVLVGAVSLGMGVAHGAPLGQQTATPPTVTIANNSSNVNLSETGGVETTVASMQLAHGKYLLTANGELFSQAETTGNPAFQCEIFVGTKQVATMSNLGKSVEWTVALTGVAKVGSSGATATLQCEDFQSGLAPTPYMEADASLMAERVNSVSVIPG